MARHLLLVSLAASIGTAIELLSPQSGDHFCIPKFTNSTAVIFEFRVASGAAVSHVACVRLTTTVGKQATSTHCTESGFLSLGVLFVPNITHRFRADPFLRTSPGEPQSPGLTPVTFHVDTTNGCRAAGIESASPIRPATPYIDLIKRSTTNFLYAGSGSLEQWEGELNGGHTSNIMAAVDLLDMCARDVVEKAVPGAFAEVGVFRGGQLILLAAIAKEEGARRRVYGFDTFSGIPISKDGSREGDLVNEWSNRYVAPLDFVSGVIQRYGFTSEIQLVVGDIANVTTKQFQNDLSLIHIDVDSYTSTRHSLEKLYPHLSVGGYVILEDWHIPSARRAVHDYRRENGIVEQMNYVLDPGDTFMAARRNIAGGKNAYWVKTRHIGIVLKADSNYMH